MLDAEPLRLQTPTVRTGEKLRGELLLPQAAPGLEQARRVTIRAWGRVEYLDTSSDHDKWRHHKVPGSLELIREWPSHGEPRLPFELQLSSNLPPSYRGVSVVITWEAVASVSAEDGKELRSWSQPFQLEVGRTTRMPEALSPIAPKGSSLVAASTWGCLLLPALSCFLLPLTVLFGDLLAAGSSHSGGERAVGILFCLALIAGGVVMTRWIITHARTISKFKAASLVPLAERFPLGATARMRVFLDCAQALRVRGAELELTAHETSRKLRSTGRVAVKVPAQLRKGPNQFDVELPIPRDFPPTFRTYLTCMSTLSLQLEGLEPMTLNGELKLAPEVLEAAAEA